MINIDAKVKDSNGCICRVDGVYDDEILVSYGGLHAEDSDFLKHGTYTVIEDIRSDLEQQKKRADELEQKLNKEVEESYQMENRWRTEVERADELEKRWSEMRNKTIETYATLKKEKSILAQYIGSILCVMDEIEGKENVFETVQSLEDNNA
ncbi:hypothetical protein [Macrococcoides caseolyticum]|uniref:hypothetical protein n=1 Tax=Macrococcoides caseolyticum TaxID=69966 RepID=UPI0024BCBA6D|nr:hypothetical protein [Macrococcus caseolyticus]MDJ1088040.1 hypothetical protein [Macrococcus caseolyticus]